MSDEAVRQQVELLGSHDRRVATAAYNALMQAGPAGLHAIRTGLQH